MKVFYYPKFTTFHLVKKTGWKKGGWRTMLDFEVLLLCKETPFTLDMRGGKGRIEIYDKKKHTKDLVCKDCLKAFYVIKKKRLRYTMKGSNQ